MLARGLILALPLLVGVLLPSTHAGLPLEGEDFQGWANPDPLARTGHAMAYDSGSDLMVMFGSGETWAYDVNTNIWTDMRPAVSPSVGSGHAMAYDAESDLVILFGGWGSDETWSYDLESNVWTNQGPPSHPSARDSHAMVYDAESDRVIVFGGLSPLGRSNETWAYDVNSNTWTELVPVTHPSARTGHAMAYDAVRDRSYLFGGSTPRISNETWAYDFNANEWTKLSPTSTPSGRHYHRMVYDSQSDRVIMFGGGDHAQAYGGTFAFDPTSHTWTTTNPAVSPVRRFAPALAYDSESDRVILFRGTSAQHSAFPNPRDTWAYDFDAEEWTLLATFPPALRNHGMAYDLDSDRVILFGGWRLSGSTGAVDETWVYDVDTAQWTRPDPVVAPKNRFRHAMAYDWESDRVILFGGCCTSSGALLADTWAYDFNRNTWTDMAPAAGPSARIGHAMAYDSESDLVILFGGSGSDETWSYDYNANTWALLEPILQKPSGRDGHAMAYDVQSDRVILFGGSVSEALTWAYDSNLNIWVPLLPLSSPSPRSAHAMAYDGPSDRIVLFGGNPGTGLNDETWSYDFETNTWRHLTPERSPFPRQNHAMAYDSHSDRVVLFGGNGDDTWLFELVP